jgi:hypothetical protein
MAYLGDTKSMQYADCSSIRKQCCEKAVKGKEYTYKVIKEVQLLRANGMLP